MVVMETLSMAQLQCSERPYRKVFIETKLTKLRDSNGLWCRSLTAWQTVKQARIEQNGSQNCTQASHCYNLGEFQWAEESSLLSFVLFPVPKLFCDCLLPTQHIDELDDASAPFFPEPRRPGAFGDVRQAASAEPTTRAGPSGSCVLL